MTSLLAGDFYLWWRADVRLRRTRRARLWRSLVAAFVLLQITYMMRILLWPYVPRHDSNGVIVWGFCLAYAWHLLAIPITLLAMGIGRLISVARREVEPPMTTSGEPVSRRDILRGAAVAVPPLLAMGGLGIAARELSSFRIRRITLPLRALPPLLNGMTIALVSDTHVGRFTNDRTLDAIAAASNALSADLTLFVGDLIDIAQGDLDPAIRFASRLRGRYGVFFCEGNHDLIEDSYRKTNVFETRTRAAGLPMLFDEAATVRVRDQPVRIIGSRWSPSTAMRDARTQRLMNLRDPEAFNIYMTHHPHGWEHSTTPLTLSGHTHGGQLMLNERIGIGPILFRYWSGLYRRDDQALVVCNGTGNWFPVRIMAPAEIIHLTLTCA
jgi:predicted MPP superfamily phosphohydrolase